jgi:hypothetical protein
MLLERFVILLSVFVIVSTIVSFVFHERVHLPTGSNRDGTVPPQHSYYLANEKKFLILNETLSSLKAELQFIRSIKEPISVDSQPTYPPNITHGEIAVPLSSIDLVQQKDEAPLPQRMALLFTMDSIRSYESRSKQGGAAGEILVRRSLEKVFGELKIRVDVKGSDEGSAITFSLLENSPKKLWRNYLPDLCLKKLFRIFRIRICRHESLRFCLCGSMDLGCKR